MHNFENVVNPEIINTVIIMLILPQFRMPLFVQQELDMIIYWFDEKIFVHSEYYYL